MGGVPLWAWILGAVGVVLLLVRHSLRSYRREVRVQFMDWLERHHPNWTVKALDGHRLSVDIPTLGELTIGLDRLFGQIARTRDRSARARAPHFEAFARPLADQVITPEKDAERLRPRLVTPEWLAAVPADQPVVHRPLGDTTLSIAYVLDSPQTVTFVTERQRAQLGLDPEALHQRALENLRPTLPAQVVRSALEGKLSTLKSGDSFDAARLLLVPEHLAEGESLAACVPDRDTLVLLPAPDDWETLVPLAVIVAGPPLLPRPLCVTRSGVVRR
jgi:uncharacterized protein YtpQ (UPF0354 family)